MIKRFLIFIQFSIVFILMLSVSSCDSDNGFDYMGFEHRYHYEDEDTVVSASEHEFVLSMITDKPGDYIPDDWKIGTIDYLITDKSDPLYGEWFPPKTEDIVETANSISLDWIKFEKISENDGPKLKVVIKENTSGDARGARFSFGNSFKNYDHAGEVCVVQKGMPDKEPFTMKIRYKGKVYSTEAHLDMDENVIYDDKDFKDIITFLNTLEDLEAIVMDDEIVDYFDKSDFETRSAVASLRKQIDANCDIFPVKNILFTRANDGFQYYQDNYNSTIGYFAMFDDTNFKDTHIARNINTVHTRDESDYMKNIGLNDKVSSLAVGYFGDAQDMCSVLTVWEDSYFNYGDVDRQKHRISFVADSNNRKVSRNNLKNIMCLNSGKNWNDRISSYSFNMGIFNTHLKDY